MRHTRLLAVAMLALAGAAACNNDNSRTSTRTRTARRTCRRRHSSRPPLESSVNAWVGSDYDLRGTSGCHSTSPRCSIPTRTITSGCSRRLAQRQDGSTSRTRVELEDYRQIIRKSASDAGTSGPALIMRTWDFSYLTNTFGDIPYFAALAGDSISGGFTPKYDAQKDIYTDFFKVLDAASKSLVECVEQPRESGSDLRREPREVAEVRQFAAPSARHAARRTSTPRRRRRRSRRHWRRRAASSSPTRTWRCSGGRVTARTTIRGR